MRTNFKNRVLVALVSTLLMSAAASADESASQTERVVMRHFAANAAGDASVVPRDYAKDAIFVLGNQTVRGVEKIQRVLGNLYARTKLHIDITRSVFEGPLGYVVWSMGEMRGSDTFVVRDDKIVMQTSVAFGPPREDSAD